MSSRIEGVFGQGRRALVGYITAGDPNLEVTLSMMRALEEGEFHYAEASNKFCN